MEMEKEELLILKSLRWKGKSHAKAAVDLSKTHTENLNGVFFCHLCNHCPSINCVLKCLSRSYDDVI
jgi:Fe-S-cluster-containing dehydrogenase component